MYEYAGCSYGTVKNIEIGTRPNKQQFCIATAVHMIQMYAQLCRA